MFRGLMVKIDNIIHVQMRQCSVSLNISKNTDYAVVQITDGKLRGAVNQLFDAAEYYSFKGIKYGEAPVGKLRFKAPLPVKPWEGVKDALEHGSNCPHSDLATNKLINGSEDCLYLNVYSRSLSPAANKPVMFFLHGGGFMAGSGDSDNYGPEYLLQHDVVLVTLNYRLEAFGFLCLESPSVPGNAGMRDQVLALKWVQKNIAHFGGNPQNVTLFGESAGAASVTYHMISPLSKGLFHKAISQSGVFLNDWTQGKDGKEGAIRAAKAFGKTTTSSSEIFDLLQSVPAKDLVKLTNKSLSDERYRVRVHFAPVVEKKFVASEPFLPEDPVKTLHQNKIASVPLMIGYNSGDGLTMLPFVLRNLDLFNKNIHYRVPREIARKVPKNVELDFGKRIREFYFNGKDLTKDSINEIVDLETDYGFTYGIHRFIDLYTKSKAPIYMFRFDCNTEMDYYKKLFGLESFKGMCHADDLFYMFSSVKTADIYKNNEDIRNMVFNITKMWTDFAKHGTPTPDNSLGIRWEQFTQKSKKYLNIGNKLTLEQYAEKDRIEFWNKLYIEAGLPFIRKIHM